MLIRASAAVVVAVARAASNGSAPYLDTYADAACDLGYSITSGGTSGPFVPVGAVDDGTACCSQSWCGDKCFAVPRADQKCDCTTGEARVLYKQDDARNGRLYRAYFFTCCVGGENDGRQCGHKKQSSEAATGVATFILALCLVLPVCCIVIAVVACCRQQARNHAHGAHGAPRRGHAQPALYVPTTGARVQGQYNAPLANYTMAAHPEIVGYSAGDGGGESDDDDDPECALGARHQEPERQHPTVVVQQGASAPAGGADGRPPTAAFETATNVAVGIVPPEPPLAQPVTGHLTEVELAPTRR